MKLKRSILLSGAARIDTQSGAIKICLLLVCVVLHLLHFISRQALSMCPHHHFFLIVLSTNYLKRRKYLFSNHASKISRKILIDSHWIKCLSLNQSLWLSTQTTDIKMVNGGFLLPE